MSAMTMLLYAESSERHLQSQNGVVTGCELNTFRQNRKLDKLFVMSPVGFLDESI